MKVCYLQEMAVDEPPSRKVMTLQKKIIQNNVNIWLWKGESERYNNEDCREFKLGSFTHPFSEYVNIWFRSERQESYLPVQFVLIHPSQEQKWLYGKGLVAHSKQPTCWGNLTSFLKGFWWFQLTILRISSLLCRQTLFINCNFSSVQRCSCQPKALSSYSASLNFTDICSKCNPVITLVVRVY